MDLTPFPPVPPAGPFKVVKPTLHVGQWDGTKDGAMSLTRVLAEIVGALGAQIVSAHRRADTRDQGGIKIEYTVMRDMDEEAFYFTVFPHNWVVIWEGIGVLQDIEVIGARTGDRRFIAPVFTLRE